MAVSSQTLFNTHKASHIPHAMTCKSQPAGKSSNLGYVPRTAVLLTLLLLLLSHFSCVQLCVTPQTAAHQTPLSLGFSKQEHWVGCHFLLQCMKVQSEREVTQSCPTLCDPMDCSLPGSSLHGICQARVLEWDAIAFSGYLPYLLTFLMLLTSLSTQ